jgi:hypothetical protein
MQKSMLDAIIWALFLGGLVGFAMALLKLFGGGTPEEQQGLSRAPRRRAQ